MKTNICDNIENDEFYKEFLKADAAAAETKNANASSMSISDQIKKLSEGVELLATELQTQVRQEHGALLTQASHAGKLTTALDAVNGHMSRLEAGADRLKAQINVPYAQLENQTRVLARLHEASHLLRQAGRFLQLFRKLQTVSKNPAAQASLLYELEPLLDDEQLVQVDFVRDEKSVVLTLRQRLNNLANRDLTNSLKNLRDTDRSKVVNSLQIYANLQTLTKCIDTLLDTFISDIEHSIKECFTGTDVANLSSKKPQESSEKVAKSRGPGKTPTLTTSQHFRTKLWTALAWLFDEEIYNYWNQVIFLESSLEDVKQPATVNVSTLLSYQNNAVKERFWKSLEEVLRNSFTNCAPHVNQCLKQDLPKLLKIAHGLQSKFGQKFTFSDNVFESLEAGYLEKCALNLKAPLTGTDMPTEDAVDSLVQAATTELTAALIDNRLSMLVAAVFVACNRDFWTKIEAHVKFGTDSQQVVDVPNAAQLQNITLANTIYYHNVAVKRMLENMGSDFSSSSLAASKILDSLGHGTKLVMNIVQQLLSSIKSATNIILLSMHREPGLNSERAISSGPSWYIKELNDFLTRAWNLHIAPFADKELLSVCGKELAERCIELFSRNVAILRPVSKSGRNRLKSDCQHLETYLSPIAGDLSQLGRPYRLLRSLSSLIALPPEDLANQSTDVGGPVSPFIILLLLFGYAGSDLASPHTAAGWSNEKVIVWLDAHKSDKERLELVTGALQKYRTIIRQRNVVQYDPVYPYISGYLDKVSKGLS